MNKKFEKNLNKLRVDLIASNKLENKKISSVLSWLNKRQKFDKTNIIKTGLDKLKDWNFNNNGELNHKTGQFFSVIGLKIKNLLLQI